MKFTDLLKDLTTEKLNKMNRKELAKVVSKLNAVANKRLKRLEEKEKETSAYNYVMRSGGKFSVRGKNLNELRKEYKRVSGFLQSKTSTLKGAKQVENEFLQRVNQKNMTDNQKKDFWTVYTRIEQLEPNFAREYGSERLQRFIAQEMNNGYKDIDDLLEKARNEIDESYERTVNDVWLSGDDFFEI